MAKKMGRPTRYKAKEMCPIIDKYTDETEMPIIKEVCFLNGWVYKRVFNIAKEERYQELRDSLDRLLNKKEIYLEKELIKGKLNPAGAIFSLKQLGWTEKKISEEQKEKQTLENELLKRNIAILDEKIKLLKGETDLTQIKDFLVEVKKVVDIEG